MHIIPINAITVSPDRQRKDIKPSSIAELKKSILSHGLLHPIVLASTGEESSPALVAGCTRLRAVTELTEEGHSIRHNGTPIPLGEIPFTYLDDLPEDERAEAELAENLVRTDLTWAERVQAQDTIHRLRLKKNPHHTINDTVREIAERTSGSTKALQTEVAHSILVAKHLSDPTINKAKSLDDAYKRVLDKQSATMKKHLAILSPKKSQHQVLLGNCVEVMKTLPAGTIDTVLSDPPYGIDADKMKRTEKHFYDDSPENALYVTKAIIREGFRLLKPRGIIFLFCDIEHFTSLRDFGKQQGYTAWRTPIIWFKGPIGYAPWGRAGFLRTYETALFLTKGVKELISPGPDLFTFDRKARNEKEHAAEKPIELLAHLLRVSSLPGDTILDPCCGSGSIIPACTELKMNAICIELDEQYHSIAMGKLAEGV